MSKVRSCRRHSDRNGPAHHGLPSSARRAASTRNRLPRQSPELPADEIETAEQTSQLALRNRLQKLSTESIATYPGDPGCRRTQVRKFQRHQAARTDFDIPLRSETPGREVFDVDRRALSPGIAHAHGDGYCEARLTARLLAHQSCQHRRFAILVRNDRPYTGISLMRS